MRLNHLVSAVKDQNAATSAWKEEGRGGWGGGGGGKRAGLGGRVVGGLQHNPGDLIRGKQF